MKIIALAVLLAGSAAFAQQGVDLASRQRLFVAGFNSTDAVAATGWTYNGTQSLATADAAINGASTLYLDGSNRVQGIQYNGSTAIRILGNVPVLPGSDQSISLGAPTVRWSTAYFADYQRALGTSSSFSYPQGTITTNTTAVGNVGVSGPDVLQTYTLPASGLVTTGRGFRVRAWGTTANNANAKTVSLKFGTATLITKQLTASIAGTWDIEAYCVRTGASAQDCYAVATNSGGTTVAATDGATVQRLSAFGAQTQTETGTLDIATVSTVSTTNNDIVSEGLIIEGI